jgi:Metallopeptidase family M24
MGANILRAIWFCLGLAVLGAEPPWKLPPLREQARMQQAWLKARLEQKLPALMRKHGVAMWLVICREYNEDPVFFSLVSPTTLAARRRTIYVFHDRGGEAGVERLALGGGSNGGLYTVYRDPAQQGREIMGDSQWFTLRKLIEERRPASIGINISATHAFSDGLSANEYQQLETALGPEWMKRVVRAEGLPLEYIGARLPEMMPVYQGMMQVVHWLIERAFSSEVIQPGKTTSQDIVWWLRQQTQDLGYATWFHPTVRVQKPAAADVDLLGEEAAVVIERGDVLHVDYGLTALGLNTDTQHMGYVLKEGEAAPPAGIVAALAQAQRFQDMVLAELRPGRSGNQVLAASLAAMRKADIRGSLYSHPIGDHGHGAGPLIGLWDRQEGVPGRGDVPVLPGTWFSIELNVRTPVPEWGGKELFVGMEEDAALPAEGPVHWILRRQDRFHMVRTR